MLAIILASEPSNGLIMLMGMVGLSTYGMVKCGLWLLPVVRTPKWSRRISRIALVVGLVSLAGAGIKHEYWKHQPPRFVITHQPYLYPPVASATVHTNSYGWRYLVYDRNPTLSLLGRPMASARLTTH